MFSSGSFTVSGLIFKALIHFELIFVYGLIWWSSFILCICPILPTSYIEEAILSPTVYPLAPLCIFPLYILCQKSAIEEWVYFWGLSSVPLNWVPVFMPIPYCVNYYSFVAYFKSRECDASGFVLLSQVCFGYSGLLWFHTNFRFVVFLWKVPLELW